MQNLEFISSDHIPSFMSAPPFTPLEDIWSDMQLHKMGELFAVCSEAWVEQNVAQRENQAKLKFEIGIIQTAFIAYAFSEKGSKCLQFTGVHDDNVQGLGGMHGNKRALYISFASMDRQQCIRDIITLCMGCGTCVLSIEGCILLMSVLYPPSLSVNKNDEVFLNCTVAFRRFTRRLEGLCGIRLSDFFCIEDRTATSMCVTCDMSLFPEGFVVPCEDSKANPRPA